jgi:hypothetical protein
VYNVWRVAATAALAVLFASPVLSQQPTPAPAPAQPPEQAQKGATWQSLPRMQLEQMFAGPLQDTVIQRLRDPQTGIVCYLYLPFPVGHSARTATGAVQYGPNSIGSIGCLEPVAVSAPKIEKPPVRKPPPHPSAGEPAAGEPPGQK